jgi:hypothetical protein
MVPHLAACPIVSAEGIELQSRFDQHRELIPALIGSPHRYTASSALADGETA